MPKVLQDLKELQDLKVHKVLIQVLRAVLEMEDQQDSREIQVPLRVLKVLREILELKVQQGLIVLCKVLKETKEHKVLMLEDLQALKERLVK